MIGHLSPSHANSFQPHIFPPGSLSQPRSSFEPVTQCIKFSSSGKFSKKPQRLIETCAPQHPSFPTAKDFPLQNPGSGLPLHSLGPESLPQSEAVHSTENISPHIINLCLLRAGTMPGLGLGGGWAVRKFSFDCAKMCLCVASTPGPQPCPLKSHRSSTISLQSNPQIFENGCHVPKSFLRG